MGYRFRLTFGSTNAGIFQFDSDEISLDLADGKNLELTARNADVLKKATLFHFEMRGYPDEASAREAGNHLRLRLRVLNAMLGLGLNIPTEDVRRVQIGQNEKDDIFAEFGTIVVDNVSGVSVFPDDKHYIEQVWDGHINALKIDPLYALKGLTTLYTYELTLDQKSEDALRILNLANHETSAKAAFMANYLALEPLVTRKPRSEAARALIKQLRSQVQSSDIEDSEKDALIGILDNLHTESFKSALLKLADRIKGPFQINGKPIKDFLVECVAVRNRIAHRVEIGNTTNLQELNEGLRQFILTLIWTFNGIPNITINIPAHTLSIPEGGLTMRIL